MVFGLFSRKTDPKVEPTPSTSIQLRTPSPSVIESSSPRVDDSCPPITPSPPPEDVTDPTALRALIQSIPPKIVHSYTLSHLSTASPQALSYLYAFFSSLEAPPTLHCVRCHKGYFDVENNDRSCLVGHDDDSAEVERVGKGAGYETLWGCCGKTVDGDGDMGPPDGWCYEGMHTTDPKRARFRADSTIHEDKLTSCARLRCHEPHGSVSRKRSRRAVDADSEDSDSDSGASHSSVRTRSRTSKRVRTGRAPSSDDDDDVDMVEPSTVPASPRSKSSRKPRARSVARSVASAASTRVKPANKPRSTIHFSDPPSPSKKPASTRLAPSVSSLTAAASFTSTTTSTSTSITETATQTMQVVVTPSAKLPATKVKRAMQPKSKPKSTKQPKRLNEVVESSIAGETA
ncbi:hypothetical protein DFH08DRAFT_765710 [Mycena albidolilacea]|uniref:Uncharacterized protein n=1 Tax=Mycena albidolilacea TaxID=1033008 RepID=A0AAD7F3Y7_9AGAR|nr:hypothetical protein DFH08DRAFT_765710 [Mycena albidolilacea]